MQRSEVRDTLHLLDHLVIDEDALIDCLTTMYETVTHSLDLVYTVEDSVLRLRQDLEDKLDSYRVLR